MQPQKIGRCRLPHPLRCSVDVNYHFTGLSAVIAVLFSCSLLVGHVVEPASPPVFFGLQHFSQRQSPCPPWCIGQAGISTGCSLSSAGAALADISRIVPWAVSITTNRSLRSCFQWMCWKILSSRVVELQSS